MPSVEMMTIDSEEEEVSEYQCNGIEEQYVVKIMVAGGGMMNGNAYAEVEAHYKSQVEWSDGDEAIAVYYCEYGKNPCRNYIGSKIVFNEDDGFNVE